MPDNELKSEMLETLESPSRLKEMEEMYGRALKGYEEKLWSRHTLTIQTFYKLGVLYLMQGRQDKAEEMYDRATQRWEEKFGPGHTSTLETLNKLDQLFTRVIICIIAIFVARQLSQ